MNILNPKNVKVGYGYRLLGEDEIVLMGHEVFCDKFPMWRYISWSPSRTYSKFKKEFLHEGNIHVRTKIEIPEGYRLVGEDETFTNENVKYIVHHEGICEWTKRVTSLSGGCLTPSSNWSKDSIDTYGIAYIQKNETKENNMNDKTLEIELERAKKLQLATQERIAELEKQIKEEKEKNYFKIKDYVKHIITNRIYKINEVEGNQLKFENFEDYSYDADTYVKATREEIEKYLLDKVKADGWVVGAKVKEKDGDHFINKISKIWVYFGDDKTVANIVQTHYKNIQEPFVVVNDNGFSSPIDNLELIKEEPITIVVGKETYTAEFSNNNQYVKFGCANISRRQIVNALEFIQKENGIIQESNRKFESIKIGKGEFTIELLTKLNNKFKELDNK